MQARRGRRRPVGEQVGVARAEVAIEQVEAPTIAEEMVHEQVEVVEAGFEAQGEALQHGQASEVDAAGGDRDRQRAGGPVPLPGREAGEVNQCKWLGCGGLDRLPGQAIALMDGGAQDLVALVQQVEGLLEQVQGQRTVQAQRLNHVEAGTLALDLVEEQDAGLGGRQRRGGGGSAPGIVEGWQGRCRGRALRGRQKAGQGRHGLMAEQVAGAELQTQGAGTGTELNGDQRVAAQLEEVVVDADLDLTTAAEQLREQLAELAFGAVAGAGQRAGGRCEAIAHGQQRAAIDLAVGGLGQGLEGQDLGGDHIGGQAVGEEAAELGGIGTGAGHEGAEKGIALAEQQDHGLVHARVLQQGTLDIAQLDAEAAKFDLVVEAAEEMELAGGVPVGQVAGGVDARAGLVIGIGQEAGGGQARLAEIAAGDAMAAEQQLTGRADGAEREGWVEDQHLGAGDGRADAGQVVALGQNGGGAGGHGRLGRTIGVEQGEGQVAGRTGLEAVAAGDDEAQGRGLGPGQAQQRLDQQGRHVGVGDAVFEEEGPQRFGRDQLRSDDVERAAGGQERPDFEDCGVEGGAGDQGRAAFGVDGGAVLEPGADGDQAGMADDHALGHAGRAAGENDIGAAGQVDRGSPWP